MHVNVQLRNNPQTGDRVPYYRLKESYRDVRGMYIYLVYFRVNICIKWGVFLKYLYLHKFN